MTSSRLVTSLGSYLKESRELTSRKSEKVNKGKRYHESPIGSDVIILYELPE